MEGLWAWVRGLVALAVVFSVLDLLQPDGALRGTVRTVMGLAVVAAVLGPAVELVERLPGWRATWSTAVELQEGRTNAAESSAGLSAQGSELALALWNQLLFSPGSQLWAELEPVVRRHGWRLAQMGWQGQGPQGRLVAVVAGPTAGAEGLQVLRAELASRLGLPQERVELHVVGGGAP